jgi:hypothetical protein
MMLDTARAVAVELRPADHVSVRGHKCGSEGKHCNATDKPLTGLVTAVLVCAEKPCVPVHYYLPS